MPWIGFVGYLVFISFLDYLTCSCINNLIFSISAQDMMMVSPCPCCIRASKSATCQHKWPMRIISTNVEEKYNRRTGSEKDGGKKSRRRLGIGGNSESG